MTLNPFAAFGDWASMSFGKVFTQGFDFSHYLANHTTADLVLIIATTALAFCMVDMFDTLGTLYGACSEVICLMRMDRFLILRRLCYQMPLQLV